MLRSELSLLKGLVGTVLLTFKTYWVYYTYITIYSEYISRVSVSTCIRIKSSCQLFRDDVPSFLLLLYTTRSPSLMPGKLLFMAFPVLHEHSCCSILQAIGYRVYF